MNRHREDQITWSNLLVGGEVLVDVSAPLVPVEDSADDQGNEGDDTENDADDQSSVIFSADSQLAVSVEALSVCSACEAITSVEQWVHVVIALLWMTDTILAV